MDPQAGELLTATIRRLWAVMLSLYGHSWASQYGDGSGPELNEAQRQWARVLHGLTLEQIRHGVWQTERRAERWPPNAGEFRGLCLDYRPPPQGEPKQLTHKTDPATARPFLDKMRQAVR